MAQHYITNASILLLCVFGHYLLSLRLHQKQELQRSGYYRLWTGLFFGLAGIFLISSSFLIQDMVRMDMRSLAILIATVLGGPPASVIAALCVSAARFWQGGFYYASIVGVTSSWLIALGCMAIFRKLSPVRFGAWMTAYLYTWLVIVLTYILVVKDVDVLLKLLAYYTVFSAPITWLCFQLHAHLASMKELYGQIQYNEEKYRQLFQGGHDLVYLFRVEKGRAEKYLEINEAAAAALGYSREEMLTISPQGMYDQSYLRLEEDTDQHCPLKGQQHIFEWSLKTRDGQEIPVEISGRLFRLQGEWVCLAVARDISVRKEAEQTLLEANRKLERLSMSDGLTGIHNRRAMELYYAMFWEQGLRSGHPVAVLLLDIDFFKAYNDTYGHVAGDQCLKRVAAVMAHFADRHQGIACRYGGEEFILVLPQAGAKQALACSLEIRRTIQELDIPHTGSSAYGCVTISAGVAAAIPGREGTEQENLLVLADKALYMAKHSGRNRVMVWENEEQEDGGAADGGQQSMSG